MWDNLQQLGMPEARQQGWFSHHVWASRPPQALVFSPLCIAQSCDACVLSPQPLCCHVSICLSFLEIWMSCWTMCDLVTMPVPRGMAVSSPASRLTPPPFSQLLFRLATSSSWSQQLATLCCTFRLASRSGPEFQVSGKSHNAQRLLCSACRS